MLVTVIKGKQYMSFTIKDFVFEQLHYHNGDNGKDYFFTLPLKTYIKGGKPSILGGKSDMTREEHYILSDNGKVDVKYKNKEGIYRYYCLFEECELIELHFNCVETNLCVIDIDDTEKDINNFPEIIKNLPYTKSRNKKLPHYFCIIDGIDKSILRDKVKITTNCLNFCKGDIVSSHVFEKPNGEFYNYNKDIGIPHIHIDDLKIHLQDNILKKIFGGSKKTDKERKQSEKNEKIENIESDTEDECETVDDDVSLYEKNDLERKLDKLTKISECYKIERIDDYKTWFEITMAIKNTFGDKGKEIWNTISKKSLRYDHEKNIEKWHEYKGSDGKKCLKFGSLMMWAKEDNEELYYKIIGSENKIDWLRLTDYTFASTMYNLYFKDKLLFTNGNDGKNIEAYFFNGNHWIKMGNGKNEIKQNYFKKLYKFYERELNVIKDELDEKTYAKYHNNIKILDNDKGRRGIIGILQDEYYEKKIEWNKNKYLFAFNNKIYDLKKGEFVEPNPKDYINFTCGYDYEEYDISDIEEAKNKIYEFLESIICIEYKNEQTKYLLKLLATFLVQCNREEKGYFWLGRGRNGKGTLSTLLMSALGKYFGSIDVGYYTIYDKSSNGPNQSLYNNQLSRVLNTSEIGDEDINGNMVKFISEKFKKITGRDIIEARAVHSNDIVQYEAGKVLIQTNVLPKFSSINESLIERIVIFNFPYTFTDDDKKIKEDEKVYKKINRKLKDLFSMDLYRIAFTEILFEYYKNYQNEGLIEPNSIIKNRNQYIEEEEDIKGWFEGNYKYDKEGENIKLKDVLTQFKTDNDIQKYDFEKFKRNLLNINGYDNYIKKIKGYYYLKYHKKQ